MNAKTVRSLVLARYDLFAKAFTDYLFSLSTYGINDSELDNWVQKIRFELETAVFVGLVVKTPPPRHLEFNLVLDVRSPNAIKKSERRQNPRFCRWFRNLHRTEFKKTPKHGTFGYRIIHITPHTETERVRFHRRFGWIPAAEWKRL